MAMNEHTVITGKIHSLETFGLVDGPGVRCVVFLQGCHMRCRYCHNPETWSMQGGEDSTAEEMFRKVYRYRNYWGKDGGLTVSGGEPLLQLDFVTEFFRLAKEKKVNTALDTSGNPFSMNPEYLEKFDRLMELTDLFLLDIKAVDGKLHKELTGQPNDNILAMAHYLADHGKSMWIRHVLVPGADRFGRRPSGTPGSGAVSSNTQKSGSSSLSYPWFVQMEKVRNNILTEWSADTDGRRSKKSGRNS